MAACRAGLFLFAFLCASQASAQAAPASTSDHEPPSDHGPTYPVGGYRLQTFPGSSFYPRYLADPRQPMMKAAVLHVLSTDTERTGNPLLEFTLGGRVRLLRLHPATDAERGVQLSAEAAFIGRFDPDSHYDSIGWNGYYSLRFTFKPLAQLALKLAGQHDSGHIGDEYIQRTGRRRLTYTREEVAVGAMYQTWAPVRIYGEAAYALHLGDDTLRPWRTQAGVEVEFGLAYAALDTTHWQELSWRPTVTAQLGVKLDLPSIGRRYGLALQFENGRSLLSEFYRDRNRTIGGVFWVDL